MKLGLFFLDFYLWEKCMRMMLEFSRRRVFLNKKQEFTRKVRDINTNINGGEKKTFLKKQILKEQKMKKRNCKERTW